MSKILNLVIYPNPRLKKMSAVVAEVDDEIRDIISDMQYTLKAYGGVGLSAIQVGFALRIFIMDTTHPSNSNSVGPRIFVNPEIIEISDELSRCDEGCLSFPGLFTDLKRAHHIKVKYLDENGVEGLLNLEGLDAVCFQHELDHLNGITFFDRMSPLKKEMARKKMKKLKLV